jgi:hypothetical protein
LQAKYSSQCHASAGNGEKRSSVKITEQTHNEATKHYTPEEKDMLAVHQQEIHTGRDRKLEAARKQLKNRRQRAA